MQKVLEFIRVSTEGQAASDRASIPAQRAINRRTCAAFGLEIVKSIEIADVSGAMVMMAPEMQHLIQLIQDPEIHGVVAREFSRLMRPENFADFVLLQVFADSQTILYLPEGPIDFSSKTGKFMGTIRAAMAGFERTEQLERTWTAKEEKRKRGELAQSRIVLPFGVGYDAVNGFYYKPQTELVKEAYRQFLAGNHNYNKLAKLVGVTPRGMHCILRNPIWMGWRVIDKKRDTSSAGRYQRINGRQADRRKVPRTPENIIRVRVIDQPLVTEEEFQAVQRIMDLKEKKHWRSRDDYQHRFTYNGFLTCSRCGEPVQTALSRRDYYLCRGRRNTHTCSTKYMTREKLEASLDQLFSFDLSDPAFIERCIEEYNSSCGGGSNDGPRRIAGLTAQVQNLREKRSRVIDAFVDGTLAVSDRDRRLADLDREIAALQDALLREIPSSRPSTDDLVRLFAPLVEWEFWTREQKRQVLSAIAPDIRVADYQIQSVGIFVPAFSNESTHTDKDSWRRRA
ncbi:MAG TPA: recombinase family protein [Terriglobales bacterium]|nr:recombinase family protein [Terriglobales bacterium]